MSVAGAILLALWMLAGAVSFACVRDVFSPDKMTFAALGIFFGDIFFQPYPLVVIAAYALLLLGFVATVVVMSPIARQAGAEIAFRRQASKQSPSTTVRIGPAFFWFLSLPALAAQVAIIANFGGIEGYISVLAMRVIEFQGLGWLSAIIQTFAIVDLMYFAFLATRPKTRAVEKAAYGAHLLLFVIIALLTGSRGSLLVNFVLMAMVHHLLVRRVSVRVLVTVALTALLVASVLEVAREGVTFGDEGLVTGLSESRETESTVGFAWAAYGTLPLRLVLEADDVRPHYGFTYLTLATNAFPRVLWPEKPDSGGVVLTKEYTGDAWDGASHLSTGILPEAIINFGQAGGLLLGLVQFIAIQGMLIVLYLRFKQRIARRGPYDFVHGVRFTYVSWAMMALIVGEFTNIMITLAVQWVTVWLVCAAIRWCGLVPLHPPRMAAR